GNATASTVLKGAGQHRLLAWNNVLTAIANLVLSIALVRPLGIAGVAIGTLVPVTVSSLLIVFPAGCRRVELGLGRAYTEAVWPAIWPAALMAVFVAATRPLVPTTLPAVLAEIVASLAIYAVTFFAFGVTPIERQLCLAKTHELLARARFLASPMSE